VILPADLPESVRQVAILGTVEAAAQLECLALSGDRAAAKAARRALFALRRAGVGAARPSTPTVAPSASSKAPTYAVAFATTALSSGTRAMVVGRSETDARSVLVQMSEERGLMACREGPVSSAEFRARCAMPPRGAEPWPAAFIPIPAAHRLVAEALATTRSCGEMVPHGTRSLLAGLATDDATTQDPPIYEFVSASSAETDPLNSMSARKYLARHGCFPPWPTSDEIEEWRPKLEALTDSRIVMSEAVGRSRVEAVFDEALDAIVTEERRLAFVRRLEWDALVFWCAGDKGLARMAVHHALRGKRPGPSSGWPLVRLMVSLLLLEDLQLGQDDDNRDEETPTIIVPGR
jgi:hypothetical protein